MKPLPQSLQNKLEARAEASALRAFSEGASNIDYYSNDYLNFTESHLIQRSAEELLSKYTSKLGATGSRLLSGNHELYTVVEAQIANFHNAPKALIFNSGYNANIGFFSCVPQRGDIVFYDEYIHASIRDGLKLSLAKSYSFKHNDVEGLREKSERITQKHEGQVYIVTESVFSMDGDSPDLISMAAFCAATDFLLVVDEAHALGVFGNNGAGLVQELRLQDQVFAQIFTYGKALGCHGAAILCNEDLYSYLVNYARSLIYTTALPSHAIASIGAGYEHLGQLRNTQLQVKLSNNIAHFNREIERLALRQYFPLSNSAIQSCLLAGNENVKAVSVILKSYNYAVKPILSPTVPLGKERMRFCLHSNNTPEQITQILEVLVNTIP